MCGKVEVNTFAPLLSLIYLVALLRFFSSSSFSLIWPFFLKENQIVFAFILMVRLDFKEISARCGGLFRMLFLFISSFFFIVVMVVFIDLFLFIYLFFNREIIRKRSMKTINLYCIVWQILFYLIFLFICCFLNSD